MFSIYVEMLHAATIPTACMQTYIQSRHLKMKQTGLGFFFEVFTLECFKSDPFNPDCCTVVYFPLDATV